MIPMNLEYIRVHEEAVAPAYAHEDDACFDLCVCETVTIPPHGSAPVDTGLVFNIKPGYVMKVYIRSGIAAKTKVRLSNATGIIDAGYRNTVKLLLDNIGDRSYTIQKGTRIAQAEIVKKVPLRLVETETIDETERGMDGIGSSGFI